MATRVYIAILLILHSNLLVAAGPVLENPRGPQTVIVRKKKSRQSLTEYLIRKVVPPKWADFQFGKEGGEGDGEGDGSGNADGDGSGFGSNGFGNGSGGAGGLGSGSGNKRITMDENADGSKVSDPGPKDPPVTPPTGGPGSPPGKPPVKNPYWWPVCVFVDPTVPDGNAVIKKMVELSHACQVTLEVLPFTIRQNYNPNAPEEINNKQRESCNINEMFGVADASTQSIVPSDTVSDEMCGQEEWNEKLKKMVPTTDVAGCAEVRSGGGIDDKYMKDNRTQGHGMGGFAKGGVAVSIVDRQGWTSGAVASHEAIGHSQMGWPNGKEAGNGIGRPGEKTNPNGGHDDDHGDGTYTGVGCAQMRAKAYANDGTHLYDPDRTLYYVREDDPQRQFDLGAEKVYRNLTPPKGVPPTVVNPPPSIVRGEPPGGDKPQANSLQKSGDLVLANGADAGHKKKNLGGGSVPPVIPPPNVSISNPGPELGVDGTPESAGVADGIPPGSSRGPLVDADQKPQISAEIGKKEPKTRITMDEAKRFSDTGFSDGGSSPEPFAEGAANPGRITMDENASGRERISDPDAGSRGIGEDIMAGISADLDDFSDKMDKDFFKIKKKPKAPLKRGEGLRRGGGALRSTASTAQPIYQNTGTE